MSISTNGAKPLTTRYASGSLTGPLPAGTTPIGQFVPRDMIARRRDRLGNRIPDRGVRDTPLTEDRPAAETALRSVLERIAQTHPLLAEELHYYHDQRLLPTLRRHHAIRQEEEAACETICARVSDRNASAMRHLESLRAQRAQLDLETPKNAPRLEELDARLTAAQDEAARRVAAAGGQYDPASPSEEAVLRLAPMPLESLAAAEGLPWTPGDGNVVLPIALAWGMTGLVGTMIGLSLGIMAGLIPVDAISRHPVMALLCALIGFAAATCGKQAVALSHRQASERGYLGLDWRRRAAFVIGALCIDAAIILIDSYVEREGLLANMRLRDLTASLSGTAQTGRGGDTPLIYLFAAILVNVGYVISAAWEGYYKGRHDVIVNRLTARQTADARAAEAARRADPVVQAALAAIARVTLIQVEQRAAGAGATDEAAALDAKIARLEASLLPDPELSDEAKRRIQDSWDTLEGCQAYFDAKLHIAMREWRRANVWWRRLGRAYLERTEHRVA